MTPAKGSILQFTPDPTGAWEVVFTHRRKKETIDTWTEPVLGWAVVCVATHDTGEYESELEAVVLSEGIPSTMSSLRESWVLDDGDGHILSEVRRALWDKER